MKTKFECYYYYYFEDQIDRTLFFYLIDTIKIPFRNFILSEGMKFFKNLNVDVKQLDREMDFKRLIFAGSKKIFNVDLTFNNFNQTKDLCEQCPHKYQRVLIDHCGIYSGKKREEHSSL